MLNITAIEENNLCVGRIYKCKINTFINKKGEVIYQKRMLPQKRMSCGGCEHCSWLLDEIKNFIDEDILTKIQDPIDGQYYRLEIVNQIKDWETGIIDEYEIAFVKMEA